MTKNAPPKLQNVTKIGRCKSCRFLRTRDSGRGMGKWSKKVANIIIFDLLGKKIKENSLGMCPENANQTFHMLICNEEVLWNIPSTQGRGGQGHPRGWMEGEGGKVLPLFVSVPSPTSKKGWGGVPPSCARPKLAWEKIPMIPKFGGAGVDRNAAAVPPAPPRPLLPYISFPNHLHSKAKYSITKFSSKFLSKSNPIFLPIYSEHSQGGRKYYWYTCHAKTGSKSFQKLLELPKRQCWSTGPPPGLVSHRCVKVIWFQKFQVYEYPRTRITLEKCKIKMTAWTEHAFCNFKFEVLEVSIRK